MIGHLRHRITFEQPTITKDAAGGVVRGWAAHVTVWAEVRQLTTREYYAAMQANSEAQGMISLRNRGDLSAKMRVKWGSKILHIVGPMTTDTKGVYMQIPFKEAIE